MARLKAVPSPPLPKRGKKSNPGPFSGIVQGPGYL